MPDPISWSFDLPYYLAALAFGYLLGSIPFGLLFTKMAGHGDIRNIGSGNIGTTNVLRTGSKKLAALTLLCDALKGTVAVVLINLYMGGDAALIAGLGAFLGHIFPVWLKFKGGKGVATYIASCLASFGRWASSSSPSGSPQPTSQSTPPVSTGSKSCHSLYSAGFRSKPNCANDGITQRIAMGKTSREHCPSAERQGKQDRFQGMI